MGCQVPSDWGANVKLRVDGCCFIFFREWGGGGGLGEVRCPAGRNMFSFSHCATSHWEEDGGNYGRQQLRGRQASAHQSALLHCCSVCAGGAAWGRVPPSGGSLHKQLQNATTTALCSRGLESERRSLFPLRINFHRLIAAFITRVQ